MTGDPNSSNDQSCTGYTMTSPGGSNSYDWAVTDISITNPSVNPGGSIAIGTALNQIRFELTNQGTSAIPPGVTWAGILTIGSVTDSVFFPTSSSIAANASVGLLINCAPQAFDKDFPSSAGSFNVSVRSVYTPDPRLSNNIFSRSYTMTGGGGGPVVSGINPTSGNTGTIVTISGTNLPNPPSTVLFAPGVAANVISSTANSIVVTVPNGAQTGVIQIGTGPSALFTPTFTIGSTGSPTITGISPTAGPVGTTVVISGTNLPNPAGSVRFAPGVSANIVSNSATRIEVLVPTGAQSGPIQVGSGNLFSSTFTVTTSPIHNITSIAPTAGPIGSQVSINGTNFSPTPSNNRVEFTGGIQASVLSANPGLLVVQVPAGTQDGPIELTIGGISIMSSQSFTVSSVTNPPTITDFSPKKGIAGMQVTLSGTNFNDTLAKNQVQFANSVTANIISASTTQLVVEAPAAGTDGPISVTVGTTTTSTAEDFVYTTDPVITSFSPGSGPRGASVTINGANFDPVGANNSVFFGTEPTGTPLSSANGRRLIAIVPAAVGFGSVPISVQVAGKTAIADDQFHVDITGLEDASQLARSSFVFNRGILSVNSGTQVKVNEAKLSVISMDGKLVYSSKISEGFQPWKKEIALDLTPGVYIVNLSSAEGENIISKFKAN